MAEKSWVEKLKSELHGPARHSAILQALTEIPYYNDFTDLQQAHRTFFSLPWNVYEDYGFQKVRFALLGGFTSDFFVPLLKVFALSRKIYLEVYCSPFGTYESETLMDSSGVAEFAPQVIHYYLNSRNIAFSTEESLASIETQRFLNLYRTAINKFNCPVIANTFDLLPERPLGQFDVHTPNSANSVIRHMNHLLLEASIEGLYFNDLSYLSAKIGLDQWFDPRMWHHSKCAVSFPGQILYAKNLAAMLAGLLGKSKKCLILDLDHTLWGGVVGDLGPHEIEVGRNSAEGEAFVAFQEYLLQLKQRGVLLAVCSKNDRENALEPFRVHPEMVLKERDFSCFVANWDTKDKNVAQIAKELSLGMDSLVFFDDNPAEREIVRRNCPEVFVVRVPEDPSEYVGALDPLGLFETPSLTSEDLNRTQLYQAESKRRHLEMQVEDYSDFLKSLEMVAEIEPIGPHNLKRSVQLLNKTNQFNVMTRRTTEPELKTIIESPQCFSATLRLKDRFGDHGLVSLVIGNLTSQGLQITDWIMSCRVLKRGVENLLISELVRWAQKQNVATLLGSYQATEKNHLVEGLYRGFGFNPVPNESSPSVHWSYDVKIGSALPPHFITLQKGEFGHA